MHPRETAMVIDPAMVLALGGALGTVILSIGAAVRLARGRAQRETPRKEVLVDSPPDIRGAMMQRLESEIRRPYAVPPRVKK